MMYRAKIKCLEKQVHFLLQRADKAKEDDINTAYIQP